MAQMNQIHWRALLLRFRDFRKGLEQLGVVYRRCRHRASVACRIRYQVHRSG